MSKLADEIVKTLFTNWATKEMVTRLVQEGTGGAGWSANAVRAVINSAQQSVERTQSKRAQKTSSRVRKNKKVLPA